MPSRRGRGYWSMGLFGRKKKATDDEQAKSAGDGDGNGGNGADKAPPVAANDGPPDRTDVSDADKDKARQWFERARAVADTRNYDYAIECYKSGLEVWPEAVEEGHMKMRLVAMQRHAAGKKKAE